LKRKLLAMNLLLGVLLVGLSWRLHHERVDAQQREQILRLQGANLKATLPPPPVLLPVTPVAPASYIDIAAKLLFSRDRNPTVVIEPPKPAPEPPMPPLPTAHGVMLWGDPATVILSEKEGAPQKSYHPGDQVGQFKLVSVDNQKIVLEWRGRKIERPLSELVSKNTPLPEPPTTAPRPNPGLLSISGSESNSGSTLGPGVDMGGGARACVAGDTSPAGTVANGYKKVEGATPFGSSCHWETVK